MTRKSRHTVVAALSLAVAFSFHFHALASDPVRLECSVGATRVLLGEPLSANIALRAPGLKDSAVLVTSRRFLTVNLIGPQGPCKELFQADEMRKQPWSPWLDAVTLSSEIPNWGESLDLLLHYGLTSPGAYTLTIHWGSAPLDDFASAQLRKRFDQQFQGRRLVFLDKLSLDAELHFLVAKPTGIDHDAFLALKGYPACDVSRLLKDFPTSTYAACVVWEMSGAKGQAASEPANVVADLRFPLSMQGEISVPWDVIKGKKIGGPIRGADAIAWREKWFDIILKAHPNVWFADQLKVKRAIDQATLKNYQAAQADLEAIAKDDKSPMAAKAKEYLGLMKQKGWIKG